MSKRFISNNDFLKYCDTFIEQGEICTIIKGKDNITGKEFTCNGYFTEIDDNEIITHTDNCYYSYSVDEILIFLFGDEYFYLYENFS
jgi:hypothetical protein